MLLNSRYRFLLGFALMLVGCGLQAHDSCSNPTRSYSETEDYTAPLAAFEELPVLVESQVLLSSNPLPATQFGFRNALNGEFLAVASRNWYGDEKAIVDLFRFESSSWIHLKTIESPVNQAHELFRQPVIDGETLVVGAPGFCSTGEDGYCEEGTVYVFERNAGGPDNWGLVQQLDGGFKPGSAFGSELSLDKNTLVVLATWEYPTGTENDSVIYIFERDPDVQGVWSLVKRIESDDTWDVNWAAGGGGIYVLGDTLLVNGHSPSGMMLREFRRDLGGANNWGFTQQIQITHTRLHSADLDGETLMLHLQDDCVPAQDRQHWLSIYTRDEQDHWTLKQELAIPKESRNIKMDGRSAVLGSDLDELGFVLRRTEAADSWAFSARLVLDEAPGPYSDSHPEVTLDAGRAVIGAPYASYLSDREGFAVAYRIDGPVNQGHAGAWFNPFTSGQGQFIDIDPASQYLFMSWFTFTGEGAANPNEQTWYTAQGGYTGNKAVLTLYETLGGRFDDPQVVVTNPVGEVVVRFSDCSSGEMSYRFFDDRASAGYTPMYRVIPGSENLCEESTHESVEALDINRGLDGAWFDPATSGQGYFLDVHATSENDTFLMLSWFTYGNDTASGQRWLTAQGSFDSPTAELDVYETTGGSFNQAVDVDTVKVGTLSIDFEDCGNAILKYSLDEEGLLGEVDLIRVLPGADALCRALSGVN